VSTLLVRRVPGLLLARPHQVAELRVAALSCPGDSDGAVSGAMARRRLNPTAMADARDDRRHGTRWNRDRRRLARRGGRAADWFDADVPRAGAMGGAGR